MHNHSYENEFNLHVNEISFSYERMSTNTRYEKDAKGNIFGNGLLSAREHVKSKTGKGLHSWGGGRGGEVTGNFCSQTGKPIIRIIHSTLQLFSDWSKAYSQFSKSALVTS